MEIEKKKKESDSCDTSNHKCDFHSEFLLHYKIPVRFFLSIESSIEEDTYDLGIIPTPPNSMNESYTLFRHSCSIEVKQNKTNEWYNLEYQ